MSKPITAQNLVDVFPPAIGNDTDIAALAASVADELTRLYQDNGLLTIYTRIDELPESLLDILAYDFKVDWYLYDAPIEAKRRQIKSLFGVHKHLGTKGAMERALSDVFSEAVVEEWYEYGGTPYSFRIEVKIPEEGVSSAQQQRALDNVKYYKNVRSRLERVNYIRGSAGDLKCGAYTAVIKRVEIWPELVGNLDFTAKIATGGNVITRRQVEVYPAAE